jgi:malate synthase
MKYVDQEFTSTYNCPEGLIIKGAFDPCYNNILTNPALRFLIKLHRQFNEPRKQLLQLRHKKQQLIDRGYLPEFSEATKAIRLDDWLIAAIPPDLLDRRVEIIAPATALKILEALNSEASIFIADLEDGLTPTWQNMMDAQCCLVEAVNKTLTNEDLLTGNKRQLNEKVATLMVRPRGWHLEEWNIWVDGEPMSASLVDFGLYFFHNVKKLTQRGTGPYYYLPKIESHLEARLWNEVFVAAQDYMGFSRKTIKASVLIETVNAAFEMHEILYELSDHSAGLVSGRKDYIFSFIKQFKNNPQLLFSNREQLGMHQTFLRAFVQMLVQTCHRRGAPAVAGRSVHWDDKNNTLTTRTKLERLHQDCLRELRDGYDGVWISTIEEVETAKAVFDTHLMGKNQINNKRSDLHVGTDELLRFPEGSITEEGLRQNIHVAIVYLESWLNGKGRVAIYQQLEELSTVEVCRSQIWHWIHHYARLDDGRMITLELYKKIMLDEVSQLEAEIGTSAFNRGKFTPAIHLLDQLIHCEEMPAFTSQSAYELVV